MPRASAGCFATRPSGHPSMPDSAAMPTVDPSPNSAMYASRAAVEGRVASTSAVSAPLPASPCTAPMRSGRRASVQRPMCRCAGTPGCTCTSRPCWCAYVGPSGPCRAARRMARSPSPTSITATANSNRSEARAGISARRNTSAAPAVTSASVCPMPQHAPSHAAFRPLRSPVTSVETAAR